MFKRIPRGILALALAKLAVDSNIPYEKLDDNYDDLIKSRRRFNDMLLDLKDSFKDPLDLYNVRDARCKDRFGPKFVRDLIGESKVEHQFIDKPKSFMSQIRLSSERDAIVSDLNENGFSVIRVMNRSIATKYRDEFIKFANKYSTSFNVHGIADNIAHSQFMWDIRLMTKKVFTALYNVDTVITSFDTGYIRSPVDQEKFVEWFHFNQQRNETFDNYQFQPVQGLINLGDNNSGLVLIKGSHKHYDQYLRDNPTVGYGYSRVDISKMPGDLICPVVPIGCIIIWNSRVTQCNMSDSKEITYAVYVSMQPKHLARKEELELHKMLFENDRTTGYLAFGPSVGESTFRVPKEVEVTDNVLELV